MVTQVTKTMTRIKTRTRTNTKKRTKKRANNRTKKKTRTGGLLSDTPATNRKGVPKYLP